MWRTRTCFVGASLMVACSSSGSNDFFEGPEKASGSTTTTASTPTTSSVAVTSAGGSGAGSGDVASSTQSATSTSGTGGSGAAPSTTSSGGAGATDSEASASDASSTGGTSATTTTAGVGGSGDSDVYTVDVELEADSDCVEFSCPEDAPYPAACDITFTSSGSGGLACVALEENGALYIQSGESCTGTQIESGVITCSSQEPEEALSASTCVGHNKPNFVVVQGRCECEAGVSGCSDFGFN